MAIDRIKHTKPASERTFLDELEPIPYEITEEELAKMDPRMRKILFGYEEGGAEAEEPEATEEETPPQAEAAKAKREREVAKAEDAEPPVPVEEEPEPFDPTPVADFPPAEGSTITLIFAAGEGGGDDEAEALARAAAEHREAELGGRRWHAVRYAAAGAGELKRLNELLGEREDVVVLVDGKRPPFGRSLWLPLMYIFTAAGEE